MARILVVDDLPEVARAIARMLSNHETSIETDPRRAIARVVSGRFDLVLVDFDMPYMSGHAVSDALAAAHLAQPPIVLVMSGSENVASLYATGRGVLIKPFNGEELRDMVAAMLHENAERAQHHPGP